MVFPAVPKEFNEHGRHFWVLQDNGQRMMIAICNECFDNMTMEMARDIFSDVVYTKLAYAVKKGRKMFDHIRTQEVFQWFGSEQEINKYLKG